MTIALWAIAIAISILAYVLSRHLKDVSRSADARHDRLEQLLERASKALESLHQVQQERREDELLRNDDDPYARETVEERDRRRMSYQNKEAP